MRTEPRVSRAAERALEDEEQAAALAAWAATHPPRRHYTLTALVLGLLAVLAGVLLAVLVTVPLNGQHLLAGILVGGGGVLVVWAVDASTPDDDR